MRLEVKVTEDNSFPLASLIPLFPDIKRKAAVELFQTDGISGLLPIAVRAPEPQSAMAIFYNETDPNKRSSAASTSSRRRARTSRWAPGQRLPAASMAGRQRSALAIREDGPRSHVTAETGVVVAISYRGACDTWGGSAPATPPPGIYIEPTGKCLEDGLGQGGVPSYTRVDQICNQGGTVQVANCYYTTDPNSSAANDDTVQSGLHFIRGILDPSAGAGPPRAPQRLSHLQRMQHRLRLGVLCGVPERLPRGHVRLDGHRILPSCPSERQSDGRLL